MQVTKLSARNQVTLPASVVAALGLKEGDILCVATDQDRVIITPQGPRDRGRTRAMSDLLGAAAGLYESVADVDAEVATSRAAKRQEQPPNDDRLSLLPRHRQKIEEILHSCAPGVEVWAYGSRVNGRSHPGSDLDLVLRGPGLERLSLEVLGALSQAFHDSTIPFFVEAWDWARLPESFHAEIERDYVVLVGAVATP